MPCFVFPCSFILTITDISDVFLTVNYLSISGFVFLTKLSIAVPNSPHYYYQAEVFLSI